MKTVADVLHWEPYLNDEQLAELRKVACPAKIGRKQAPQDLNDITLGQLIQLEAIAAEKGVFVAIAETLLGRDEFWAHTELATDPRFKQIVSTYKDNRFLTPAQVEDIEKGKKNANWWRVYGLGLTGQLADFRPPKNTTVRTGKLKR